MKETHIFKRNRWNEAWEYAFNSCIIGTNMIYYFLLIGNKIPDSGESLRKGAEGVRQMNKARL